MASKTRDKWHHDWFSNDNAMNSDIGITRYNGTQLVGRYMVWYKQSRAH